MDELMMTLHDTLTTVCTRIWNNLLDDLLRVEELYYFQHFRPSVCKQAGPK